MTVLIAGSRVAAVHSGQVCSQHQHGYRVHYREPSSSTSRHNITLKRRLDECVTVWATKCFVRPCVFDKRDWNAWTVYPAAPASNVGNLKYPHPLQHRYKPHCYCYYGIVGFSIGSPRRLAPAVSKSFVSSTDSMPNFISALRHRL